ncbi:MAG: hypothetical protein JNG85_09435 [Spirochaetaceae bacterium]|nr:hypothetical protein [Spirochaetaceae bacterium]
MAMFLGFALMPRAAVADGLVLQRFSSARPDHEVETLLYLSLGLALGDRGYSISKEAKDADYLLTTAYAVQGSTIELDLGLSVLKDKGSPPAAMTVRINLDLAFDEELDGTLARLLELAKIGRSGRAGGVAEIGGLFSKGLVNVTDTLRTNKKYRLETMAYGGAISFIGDFASYARFAATAALDAGFLYIVKDWSLSAGPRVTASRTFLNGGVIGGGMYLTTAGLNLQLGVGSAQSQRLSVGLSGGAAFLTVKVENAMLTKTVPYADAGLQAGFHLGKDFFLGADLRFLAVLDRDILIMGAVPMIAICKEF